MEDPGDALTSTPRPPWKPLFTHGTSSLLDPPLKKRVGGTSLGSRYLQELTSKHDNDHTYGPSWDPKTNVLMLGSQPLEVEGDVLRVGNQSFAGTVGLYELIFKNKPQNVQHSDEENYARIMQLTDLHLNSLGHVKGNRGGKYKDFISRLKSAPVEKSGGGRGGGRLEAKQSGVPAQYVYWDDPNELVERLELLVSERDAGHTGLDNEILSILEELQERGLIINSARSRLFPAF